MRDFNAMVTHVTYIIMKLSEKEPPFYVFKKTDKVDAALVTSFAQEMVKRPLRVAGMVEALSQIGFNIEFKKDRIYAFSTDISAQEAKHHLICQGYQDEEFEVFLEYNRSWGIM